MPNSGIGDGFTPHMVAARWSRRDGWRPAELMSHAMLSLPPSAIALHYGQAIFEGLKAYPRPGGAASIFRPRRSAARFNRSAARLAMPALPEDSFIAACAQLVRADIGQVPADPGASLYLRPFMIATEPSISLRAADEYLFGIIAAPIVSSAEAAGIAVWCQPGHVRAVPGGTGEAKCAGNYAGSLVGRAEAARHGCQEVLWLDAAERRWAEELSAMNFLCLSRCADGVIELATPPLTGTILNGNTRDSLLRLAERRGLRTAERPIELAELTRPDSSVMEALACGTAVTVLPITCVATEHGRHQIGDGRPGLLTLQLRDELRAIQEGQLADELGWMHDVGLALPIGGQHAELFG
jgi:branched-chain amino acid aminotransferase